MACEKPFDCRRRKRLNTGLPLAGLAEAWAGETACEPVRIADRRTSCALKI